MRGFFYAFFAALYDLDRTTRRYGNDVIVFCAAAEFVHVLQQALHQRSLLLRTVAIALVKHHDQRLVERQQPRHSVGLGARQVTITHKQYDMRATRFFCRQLIKAVVVSANTGHIGEQHFDTGLIAPAIVTNICRRPADDIDLYVSIRNQRFDKRTLAAADLTKETQVHGAQRLA